MGGGECRCDVPLVCLIEILGLDEFEGFGELWQWCEGFVSEYLSGGVGAGGCHGCRGSDGGKVGIGGSSLHLHLDGLILYVSLVGGRFIWVGADGDFANMYVFSCFVWAGSKKLVCTAYVEMVRTPQELQFF